MTTAQVTTRNGTIPNPNSYELPKLQAWNFPTITRGVEGLEVVDRYREMLTEARHARTEAESAKNAIAVAAAHDADAESDALIAETKLPKATVEQAIDKANEAHRTAYRLIVAANKVGAQAIEAVTGAAGDAFAADFAQQSKTARRDALAALDTAAEAVSAMLATAAVQQWVAAMKERGTFDAAVGRSLPQFRADTAVLAAGTNPLATLNDLRAVVAGEDGDEAA